MTKNRRSKQRNRALADEQGTNYTTARRTRHTGDLDAAADDSQSPPVEGRDGSFQPFEPEFWLLIPQTYFRPAHVVDLGGADQAPATWIMGKAGSGKTVLAHQIADTFLAVNPEGRVAWVADSVHGAPDPTWTNAPLGSVFEKGTITVIPISDPDLVSRLAEPLAYVQGAIDQGVTPSPVLVVVDSLTNVTSHPDPTPEQEQQARRVRYLLARMAQVGGPANLRLIMVSQTGPEYPGVDPVLRRYVNSRIDLGR